MDGSGMDGSGMDVWMDGWMDGLLSRSSIWMLLNQSSSRNATTQVAFK